MTKHDELEKSLKTIKIKTKKCQPAAWDAQDLIQTWCVPHSRLTRQKKIKIKKKKKKKLNEKNKNEKTLLLKIQLKRRNRASYQSHKERNKSKKIENGNGRMKKALKIVQWNLGAKRWENKIGTMKHLIDDFDPDLICISEANLFTEVEDHLRVIPGYKLILTDTMEAMKYCRLALLIKDEISFKVETEYMDKVTASIWISIPRKGQKK